jgi:hypothetical protein
MNNRHAAPEPPALERPPRPRRAIVGAFAAAGG